MIFFPINIGKIHWTLGILFNIGSLNNKKAKEKPCFIYLDSLSDRNCNGPKIYSGMIFEWLNHLWNQKQYVGKEDYVFNETTVKVIHGEVQRQQNGYDCGVFVCLYIYAMYKSCTNENYEEHMAKINKSLAAIGQKDADELREYIKLLLDELVKIKW